MIISFMSCFFNAKVIYLDDEFILNLDDKVKTTKIVTIIIITSREFPDHVKYYINILYTASSKLCKRNIRSIVTHTNVYLKQKALFSFPRTPIRFLEKKTQLSR